MIFREIKGRTSVIPRFAVISTRKSIVDVILIIQSHFRGQKLNFQGQNPSFQGRNLKKYDFKQIQLGTSVILLIAVILTGKFISGSILIIQGHHQGQKSISMSNVQTQYVFQQVQLGTSAIPRFDVI